VVEMQNHVHSVSDAKVNFGLVAGNLEDVKAVAEDLAYIRAAVTMEQMVKEVLRLSTNMDLVLDMEEKIDAILAVEKRLDEKMETIRDYTVRASNSSTMAADMVNKMNITEKRIDEKLKEVERLHSEFIDFNVDVSFVDFSDESKASFNQSTNTLLLRIREGKQGVKGDPGSDGEVGQPGTAVHKGDRGKTGDTGAVGRDLRIDAMGTTRERKKYGNRPIGTTYLALDQKIPMLYFRKSNTTDDWTDGIPFGSNPIKHADNATNAEKLMGMSLAQLKAYLNK
jgi:hypothetical protein